jgi:hypothetical protein
MRVLYLTMNPNRGSTLAATEGWFRALRPRGLQPVLASHRAGAFHAWALQQGIAAYPVPRSWAGRPSTGSTNMAPSGICSSPRR